MRYTTRDDLDVVHLPGRAIQSAVGENALSESGAMTVGFGRCSAESDPMEPHQHTEEVIYVVDATDAWTRFGPEKDDSANRCHSNPE